MATLRFFLPRC